MKSSTTVTEEEEDIINSKRKGTKSKTKAATLKNKKPRGFMQSCFHLFVYFKCLSEFLLYFYKCSTSMAFTWHWPLTLILYRCKFISI